MSTMDGSAAGEPGDAAPSLRERAYELLAGHWLPEGYTMPNSTTYRWQWLWDSCFHSIVWAELGDERALTELSQIFAFQTQAGFVPHMNYHPDPQAAQDPWGRAGASTITQPPMYGHAIAELIKRGMQPSDEVLDAAIRGLRFLCTDRQRSAEGLIELCHPWESGCDDSARWDGALIGPWERERWRAHKHRLVSTITTDSEGAAIANQDFAVASIGFCALVAFNALDLDRALGTSEFTGYAAELSEIISRRWDHELRTWIDDGALSLTSGRARTTDAHFALLVDQDERHVSIAAQDLTDHDAFGADYGPAGAHRDEPTWDPVTYWRGPAWPQMTYLLWVGLRRRNRMQEAAIVAAGLRAGAERSGFAEFWHPDTGQGAGAIPQSWSTLALLVDNVDR